MVATSVGSTLMGIGSVATVMYFCFSVSKYVSGIDGIFVIWSFKARIVWVYTFFPWFI